MNLCKDCAHFRPSKGRFSGATCRHPELTSAPDPVYGYCKPADPRAERGKDGICGPKGDLFVPLPAESARKWWQP